MAKELSGQSGRQGMRGKPALYVLIASVGLMAAALLGLMTWQGDRQQPNHGTPSLVDSGSKGTVANGGPANTASSANSAAVPSDNPAYPQPAVRNTNP